MLNRRQLLRGIERAASFGRQGGATLCCYFSVPRSNRLLWLVLVTFNHCLLRLWLESGFGPDHPDASARWVVGILEELVRLLEFFDAWEVCDSAVICFKSGILVPSFTIAQGLTELNVFEEDEVCDAEFVTIQVFLIAQMLYKLLHISETVIRSV